jgi:hypothetical protein
MITKEQKKLILTKLSGIEGRTLVLDYLTKVGATGHRTLVFETALRDFLLELAEKVE